MDEFAKVVQCSLGYLLDNTDPKINTQPLMEARLELIEPVVLFKPSLDYQVSQTVGRSLGWVDRPGAAAAVRPGRRTQQLAVWWQHYDWYFEMRCAERKLLTKFIAAVLLER